MKPFQFYKIESFPNLEINKSVQNLIQRNFSGQNENFVTSIELIDQNIDTSLKSIHINSEVECNDYGYTFIEIEGELRRAEFTSYRHPVDFPAYLDLQRNIVILPQPKRICEKVLKNLNSIEHVSLLEMEVNFQEVYKKCPQYISAWFRNLSARVNVAGVSGSQIQDDELFKYLMKVGELSNVMIPWQYGGVEHHLMISKSSALILQKEYKDNQKLELNVIINAFDKLLTQVWKPKEKRRKSKEYDIPVEP
ncbi:MAG: hypothetical protein LBP59_05985 [Planctomycetaceae bacterium]|jgi:hypothetical protein|nr:hypothetical protein [Planctomycetaceae bacterium]